MVTRNNISRPKNNLNKLKRVRKQALKSNKTTAVSKAAASALTVKHIRVISKKKEQQRGKSTKHALETALIKAGGVRDAAMKEDTEVKEEASLPLAVPGGPGTTLGAPSAPRRPIRKLQYQHGSPSQPDSQYGVGNQLGGMTGVSSTLGGNNMHPTPESRQPTNNTATTSTATTFTARKLVPPTRRVPATAAAVPGGTTTTAAGATETAEPLVDKPKSKRKDKVPRLPPPQTIVDGGNKKTYTRGPSLGEGGFASCYELRDEEGKRFAAKVIQKVELNTHKTKQKLFAEIKIHQVLRHENIVRYYTCFEDENFVYLLLELCESKTLMDLLKRRKVVTEPEARYYMKEIVAACAHLHQGKIIHRDLKLGNIFLSHDMHVKVGDFGLAALLQNSEERKKTICGTPNYIAPEILFETNGHSFEVDIWSLGCIINIRELNYSFPPEIPISNEAKSLITALLSPRPGRAYPRPQYIDSSRGLAYL
ncbi:Cell cycle serine/threonine-protein kinase cdc5/MSD2 [Actinomortierella ambigua]|uniref:Cell cycle serine/threonine-protein kinase cdc5/MSD2 n=1 Tax=Actinomortierella ambigua TaxID=1343610 RepID=A0A9P6Q394_9FUNG|nr:Cell cycle serine/threonine-protein kinase cdc5/MSD2 [Actinomortierella ambigua]